MIDLTRLNHRKLVLNADLIETIEATPDTVISLTTGQKLVVLEPLEEIVRRVIAFRRAIFSELLQCAVPSESSEAQNRPVCGLHG
ncbi:MAG: flagellar FlbD family protein [Bryobacteraceae bacterium]